MKCRIKINKSLRGFVPGQTTLIEVNEDGIPLDSFWRKRFKDAERDNCLEIVQDEKPKKQKKPTKPAEDENAAESKTVNNTVNNTENETDNSGES